MPMVVVFLNMMDSRSALRFAVFCHVDRDVENVERAVFQKLLHREGQRLAGAIVDVRFETEDRVGGIVVAVKHLG